MQSEQGIQDISFQKVETKDNNVKINGRNFLEPLKIYIRKFNNITKLATG